MSERATIRFEPTARTIMVPVGSTLLAAARLAGVSIDAPCGGLGRCGSCRVHAEGAVAPPSAEEQELLGGASIAAGVRLACRARVAGDAVVTVPEGARESRVLTEAQTRPLVVQLPAERGIALPGALGAVVDLGTTTIAVALADLASGETLAVAGDTNDQRAFGADVLSRVAHATAGGAAELQRVAVDQIDMLLGSVLARADVPADRLAEIVVVGNTAMTGLLLGEDVTPLGASPYAGAPVTPSQVTARDLGLELPASVQLIVPPGISAFVGSDIVAGMLATGLAERDAPTLFIDLGTNGELVLAAGGELIADSTAAGPALEGATITCGMRAEAGAIERVTRAGEGFELGVIGDREPAGICGSGLLDLVAALLDAEVLDASGKLADSLTSTLADRLVERDGVRAFVVEPGAGVVLTQKDVRAVQLAIAAVRAGIDLLLEEAGVFPAEVQLALVAGGFGYHVRAESLARVGLIPAAWQDRVAFVGNTALAGGRMYLVNTEVRLQARALASRTRTLDLAAHPAFQGRFLGALTFPE